MSKQEWIRRCDENRSTLQASQILLSEPLLQGLYMAHSGEKSAAYRTTPLEDRSGTRPVAAAKPEDLKQLMHHFVDQLVSSGYLHPIEMAAMAHKRFLDISPWPKHNPEMAFVISNYLLIQHGFPPVLLEETKKNTYRNALDTLRDTYDMDPLIELFAESVCARQQQLLDAEIGH